MEDVITEIPPPLRFSEEDLNNFTKPSTSLPSPFLLFSQPHGNPRPLHPSLLIIALSSPSLYLFHHFPYKTLIGSLILPEVPFFGNTVEPSLKDRSCNIYALNNEDPHDPIVVISCQFCVPAESAHSVAERLIGDWVVPNKVLILDSVRSQNFRGRLSKDEIFLYKLETAAERKKGANERLFNGLEYYPSGSVVDGLGAALLGRCQLRNMEGSLCVSWPEFDVCVVSLLKGLLQKDVLPGMDFSVIGDGGDDMPLRFGRSKDHLLDSEQYT